MFKNVKAVAVTLFFIMLINSFIYAKYCQFNGKFDALNGYRAEGRYYLQLGEGQYRETDRNNWISTLVVQLITFTTLVLGMVSFTFVIIPSIIIGGIRDVLRLFRKYSGSI